MVVRWLRPTKPFEMISLRAYNSCWLANLNKPIRLFDFESRLPTPILLCLSFLMSCPRHLLSIWLNLNSRIHWTTGVCSQQRQPFLYRETWIVQIIDASSFCWHTHARETRSASCHTDADQKGWGKHKFRLEVVRELWENLTRADDFLPFWILFFDLQAEAAKTNFRAPDQVQQLVLQVMASGPASLENKY